MKTISDLKKYVADSRINISSAGYQSYAWDRSAYWVSAKVNAQATGVEINSSSPNPQIEHQNTAIATGDMQSREVYIRMPEHAPESKRALMATDVQMKVLFVTGSFPPMRCGVGDYTCSLATELATDSRLRVGVLTMKSAAQWGSATSLEFFPVIERWDNSSKVIVKDVVSSWRPDLIHFQFPTQGFFGARLPWRLPLYFSLLGNPIVQTWHELTFFRRPLKFWRFILSHNMLTMPLVPGGVIVVHSDYLARIGRLFRPFLANKTVRFIPNASTIPSAQLSQLERDALRTIYTRPNCRVVVFFGLLYKVKRVELLFEIADPNTTHIVIIGGSIRQEDLNESSARTSSIRLSEYEEELRQKAAVELWKGKVTFTGFLPAEDAARVIACADAAILPFQNGAGEWNTSLHAAQAQGTFALTTSKTLRGYNAELNTYYTSPDDVTEMRAALAQYIGIRVKELRYAQKAWEDIHKAHVELYDYLVNRQHRRSLPIRRLLAKAVLCIT